MRAARRDCLEANTLAEWIEGRAKPESLDAIERHVTSCAACRELVYGMARMAASDVRESSALAASEPPVAELRPSLEGRTVGRYVVRRKVGAGAMGEVYEAHDPALDRRVALKVLRPHLVDQAGRDPRARLQREAQALAKLSHPAVITVFDVGAIDDEVFIAMELVEGSTLGAWLRERRRAWREVVAVFCRAGEGLSAAHEAGLVHRDFKPENVLVGNDGRVRVTDFGLARAARAEVRDDEPPAIATSTSDALNATMTRTGTLIGTPAYMAPEQTRGRTADARSDVFSFCVALYEALYGERPFAGSTLVDVRERVLAGEVRAAPHASGVPTEIRKTLLVGLKAEPNERFQTMRALLDDLERATRPRATRRGWLVAVAGVAASGIVVRALLPTPMTAEVHLDAALAFAAIAPSAEAFAAPSAAPTPSVDGRPSASAPPIAAARSAVTRASLGPNAHASSAPSSSVGAPADSSVAASATVAASSAPTLGRNGAPILR